MSAIHFNSIEMFYLLWLVPLLVLIYCYDRHKRKQALLAFADAELLSKINISISHARRRWKMFWVILSMILIIFALTRPGWNPKPKKLERRGRDVVFVVDVSRSMLAEDLRPNRLERAKIALLDCLERLNGDRVALVAFAGTAVVKCPLTLDYGFFRMMVEQLSVNSINRGGTMIGDALRKVLEDVFDQQEKRFKDIILITDGEDHDSFPLHAAEEAGRRGVRLLAIGLGDENQGMRIPVTDDKGNQSFLMYQGREVWSKLDADTLRKMVNATSEGKYLNVATGTIDLGDVYMKLVASAEQRELESQTVKRYEEKFQIFLVLAFILLFIEPFLSERKRKE